MRRRAGLSLLFALGGLACGGPPPASTEAPAVARLELSLAAGQLVAGQATQVLIKGFDASGDLIALGRYPVEWGVDDRIASVSDGGVVVSRVVSTFLVRATSGPVTAVLPVSVVPASPALSAVVLDRPLAKVGDEARFSGVITDRYGNVIRDVGVYCTCYQDGSVATRTSSTTLRVISRGQFALLIAGEQYGVADARINFDIRE